MATATLTSKGQVTIPASVRHMLGLQAGDQIDFVELAAGQFAIVAITKSVSDLKGLLKPPVEPVSIDDMNKDVTT
ncbi:MAG: type II toxin-antitoxin system PrlF family antitoxin [Burkholderiales bacterium]|nr:type II toxin-antitoxin system PrlF family antitoxin [Burkholderiales bacterium]